MYTGQRRYSEKRLNGVLICSADQRMTKVTKYYKLAVLLKEFIHEKNVSEIMFGDA